MAYWKVPWIPRSAACLAEDGVPLNLRTPITSALWLHFGNDVEFVFSDPRDPEIAENLTYKQQLEIEKITLACGYGHRALDVSNDEGELLFWEWDDPKFR